MVGGCQKRATSHEPGAGMDASKGLVKVYKDGYFHLRCMMDKMEASKGLVKVYKDGYFHL